MSALSRRPVPFRTVPVFDVILFDIDNVLVDTRESYLAAIRKTVERYLDRPGIVSARDVDRFKLLGGFNDDWDCSYAIITFLETAIQGKPVRFGDHRRQRIFISELPRLFPERPLGVGGLLKNLRVLYERVETPSYKKIARVFQEIYLGNVGAHLGVRPGGHKGPPLRPGLIEKERLIFPKSLLEKIRRKGARLGIVTGRNKFEAEYALKRFSIRKLFDVLVTLDDVRRAEKKTGKILRKPNPWPILEAARRFPPHPTPLPLRGRGKQPSFFPSPLWGEGKGEGEKLRFLYVGDLPDDILAAKRAAKSIRIRSAAFPKYTRDPETTLKELKKAKPDYLLKRPQDLLTVIARRRSK